MSEILVLKKAGGLRNGYERGKGTIYHGVQKESDGNRWWIIDNGVAALCGQMPSLQWSSDEGAAVTCPRCLRKLEQMGFTNSPHPEIGAVPKSKT